MKLNTNLTNSAAFTFILLTGLVSRLSAQPFTIGWHTIDGGGGFSAAGNLELDGTIGQHDAATAISGGSFSLTGGFWAAGRGNGQTTANSYTVFRGIHVSGELTDSFASDNSYLKFNPGIVQLPSDAPIWLIFDGELPNDSPNSLSVTIESFANSVGLEVTIEMFNFGTDSYDVIDVRTAAAYSDAVTTVDVTSEIDNFVNPDSGAVRIRVGWRQSGPLLLIPWTVCVDQVIWTYE
jgi:hypothetical protein